MAPVFELQHVSYGYSPELLALRDVSLQIAPGMRAAVLGANGSGKSTLLRLLDGLYFPTSGSIHAFGEPLSEQQLQDEAAAYRFRQRVGLVFQNPDVQLFNPTVFDEVAFGPLQLRWPKQQIRQRVAAMLDQLEIQHLKDRAPHRLSGGEKKRVALASVLVMEPEVLLLDEPTAALDPKSQHMVIDVLRGWAGSDKTAITTTHDLDIVGEIADHAWIFQAGQVLAQGRPAELLGNTALLEQANLVRPSR